MKSKRTRACEIPKSVKIKVNERDNSQCLICGCYDPVEWSCCHFIPRSHGGLGIEENIITLCPDHHRQFDNGANVREEWNKNLIFDKNKI